MRDARGFLFQMKRKLECVFWGRRDPEDAVIP